MTTTAARPTTREHINPILEEMITRELIGQSTFPSAMPSTEQEPGAVFAAIIPALIAAVTSQPQQAVVPEHPSPLSVIMPFLMTTELVRAVQHPHLLKEIIETRLQLAPLLLATVENQLQQITVPQPPSPLVMILPALVAMLVTQQQQPTRPSPLVSALSCALAPTIASVIKDKLSEGREREVGQGSERSGRLGTR
jgi:hypothetical protein